MEGNKLVAVRVHFAVVVLDVGICGHATTEQAAVVSTFAFQDQQFQAHQDQFDPKWLEQQDWKKMKEEKEVYLVQLAEEEKVVATVVAVVAAELDLVVVEVALGENQKTASHCYLEVVLTVVAIENYSDNEIVIVVGPVVVVVAAAVVGLNAVVNLDQIASEVVIAVVVVEQTADL